MDIPVGGPHPHWLSGTTRDFRRNMIEYFTHLSQGGDISRVRFLGPLWLTLVNHPDYIHDVLVTQRDKFIKERRDMALFGRFLGLGLLTSQGEQHRQQRALMQPAFHHRRIQSYAEIMTRHTQTMLEGWSHGQVRNIDDDMMHLALQIVAEALFSTGVSIAEANQIGESLAVLQEDITALSESIIRPSQWIPTKRNRRIAEATQHLDLIVNRVIRERRASGGESNDLLGMLLQARDEHGNGMSDAEVRDQVITLFLAGHETTANALNWSFYLLSQHPEAAQRLYSELDTVLGGRVPTLENLPQLPWAEMVIKEAMRLYPPAWSLGPRMSLVDTQIGPYTIPKRTILMVMPYTVHHDPRWWPEPERFDPERFTPEAEKARHRYAYLPFGAGERVCIGNSFAMLEARIILATIANQYRLSVYPGQQVELDFLITLGPRKGLWMQIYDRQREAVLAEAEPMLA